MVFYEQKRMERDNCQFSGTHILQTDEWAKIKQNYGWEPYYKTWKDENGEINAAALILERSVSVLGLRFKVLYIPRGPLFKNLSDRDLMEKVWDELEAFRPK